ncbi:MAG: hypothetical protein ABIB71_02390 [Candidatus Woesearchaeota archaeon]
MVAVHLNRKEDDILRGYSKLETPEERMEHKVEGNLICNDFDGLVKEYGDILAIIDTGIVQEATAKIKAILEPEQINSFLQATMKYEDYETYEWHTGLFVTQLIQNSHDAGNKSFTLNTKTITKTIHNIGYKLQGRGKNLLELIVEGDVGWNCAPKAKNLGQIYITGNVGPLCCLNARSIGKLHIGGDVGDWCGQGAENIKELYIGGNARACCGYEAENSTFKTPNRQTLRLLKKNVPKDRNNKIYFINKDGTEHEF